MTEAVLKGKAPEAGHRRKWLEQEWATEIEAESNDLGFAWPGREIPEPRRWPGYVATRTRLLRRLEYVSATGASMGAIGTNEGATHGLPPFPWVERKLVDEKVRLIGTPDLVESVHGNLRVVDLKAGVHQTAVKESQLRQLLLYAHLVATETGLPVAEVAIVDVRGHETVMTVTADEVATAVQDARAVRDVFNDSLQAGGVPGLPSRATCRFCAFRVICRHYWDARADDWSSDIAVGEVVEKPRPNVATLRLGEESVRVVHSNEVQINIGDFLAVSGVDFAGPGTVKTRWDSLIRLVAGPGVPDRPDEVE